MAVSTSSGQHAGGVGAVFDTVGVAPGPLYRVSGLAHPVAHHDGVGADTERDPIGVTACELTHPRAAHGHVEGDSRESETRRPSDAAVEEAAELGEVHVEIRHRLGLATQREDGGVAAADAAEHPAAGLELQAVDGRGGHRGMPQGCDRHAAADLNAISEFAGQHHLAEVLGGAKRMVGHGETVEAESLELGREATHLAGHRDEAESEPHLTGQTAAVSDCRP